VPFQKDHAEYMFQERAVRYFKQMPLLMGLYEADAHFEYVPFFKYHLLYTELLQ